MKCAIAIDASDDCVGDFIRTMLPDEWRPHVTVATYDQVTAVIAMVRNDLPDVLVIHSNFLLLGPEDGIADCAAASPSTRYILLHAWSDDDIDTVQKFYEPLHISIGTLRRPFDRAQFIATLKFACGWLA